MARVLHVAAGTAIVAVACLVVYLRGGRELQCLDYEYALFVTLMPLLSPVAWHHYLPLLILPLALVGQQVWDKGPSWTSLCAFLLLLLGLSLPEAVFPLLHRSLHDHFNGMMLNLLVISIPCLSLGALSWWLGMSSLGAKLRSVRTPAEERQLSLEGA
jgi:hypothetical protein